MAYRKRKDVDTRRRGHDDRRMATDIHICRWFSLFLKITKELEDRKVKLELFGKQHLVKLNRSENWFKKIVKRNEHLMYNYSNYKTGSGANGIPSGSKLTPSSQQSQCTFT